MYLETYLPNHHKAKVNGMVYDHFLIAEEKLGRPLKDGEVVHHIDGNKHNNNLENILIFQSISDHSRFHMTGILLEIEPNIFISPIQYCENCVKCGKILKHTTKTNMCRKCYNFSMRKSERPDRSELKNMIREKTFIEIGKIFKVSDNAIRKWCKNENLPFTKKEINQYSDEEWQKI